MNPDPSRSRILIIVAAVLMIVATFLAFGADPFWTDSDPHALGWGFASLACYFGSHL